MHRWIAYDDPRSPNCTIFYFDHEDHTLGGLLTSMLQLRRDVVFAGYRVAHPHDVRFELRLETDGTRSPHEVLHSTAVDCAADVSQLAKVWTHEWLLWQATAEG
ncbi:DNA-directed RNA polymerase, partial [Geopyxis carbonaria]